MLLILQELSGICSGVPKDKGRNSPDIRIKLLPVTIELHAHERWQASAGRPVFAAPNQKTGNLMRETGSIRLDSSTGDILVTIFFFFLNVWILGGVSHPRIWIIWSLPALMSFISQGYLLHFPSIFLPFVASALLPSRKQYIAQRLLCP